MHLRQTLNGKTFILGMQMLPICLTSNPHPATEWRKCYKKAGIYCSKTNKPVRKLIVCPQRLDYKCTRNMTGRKVGLITTHCKSYYLVVFIVLTSTLKPSHYLDLNCMYWVIQIKDRQEVKSNLEVHCTCYMYVCMLHWESLLITTKKSRYFIWVKNIFNAFCV